MKKKQLYGLASLTLASSILAIPTFAAAASPPPTPSPLAPLQSTQSQPTQSTEPTHQPLATEQPEPLSPLRDDSNQTVTDGLHLDIQYPNQPYIPEFTLELWSTTQNKLISTTVANQQNYDKSQSVYHLTFNIPSFKRDDQFTLILREADKVIDGIVIQSDLTTSPTKTHLKPNTSYTFSIQPVDYFEGDESENLIVGLSATKEHPLRSNLQLVQTNKVALYLQSPKSNPVKNQDVVIRFPQSKPVTVQSDDHGLIWLDRGSLPRKFRVSSKGFLMNNTQEAEIELPLKLLSTQSSESAQPLTIIPITCEPSAPQVANDDQPAQVDIQLNPVPTVSTDLSTAWFQQNLTFTSTSGGPASPPATFTINANNHTINGLPEGSYKVSTDSDLSVASTNQEVVTITASPLKLGLNLKPKYTLEIDKNGKPFDFTVINIDRIADKHYKGQAPLSFGVAPGESFMIRDNETGSIETVSIDAKSPHTKLVLGAGVVMGGTATIPHTGDDIYWSLSGLALSLTGATVSYIFYRRSRSKCD